MTQDEIIIAMAQDACSPYQVLNTDPEFLTRFAALVAAHEKKFWMEQIEVECNEAVLAEREACAKLVETTHAKGLQSIREACAAAIRARGNK